MHLTTALDELTEAELLDHADEVSRMQRGCEAQVLRIAVQHAVLNNPDTIDPEVSKLLPWGTSTARTQQIDHTEPFRHGGPASQSRVGNYGPMTTFHHRVKTHAGWQVRQPFPGLDVWRDPHGATYVVDHSGTRRLPAQPEPSPAEAAVSRAPFELIA